MTEIFVAAITPFMGIVGCGVVVCGAVVRNTKAIWVGAGLVAIPLLVSLCIIAQYYF